VTAWERIPYDERYVVMERPLGDGTSLRAYRNLHSGECWWSHVVDDSESAGVGWIGFITEAIERADLWAAERSEETR
jgi:hypothetical protein